MQQVHLRSLIWSTSSIMCVYIYIYGPHHLFSYYYNFFVVMIIFVSFGLCKTKNLCFIQLLLLLSFLFLVHLFVLKKKIKTISYYCYCCCCCCYYYYYLNNTSQLDRTQLIEHVTRWTQLVL